MTAESNNCDCGGHSPFGLSSWKCSGAPSDMVDHVPAPAELSAWTFRYAFCVTSAWTDIYICICMERTVESWVCMERTIES